MDPKFYEYLQYNPHEHNSVRKETEVINKQTKNAAGITGLVSGVSIVIGLFITFIPLFESDIMIYFMPISVFVFAFAVIYLWLSVGIKRRSRACVLAAACILIAETFLFTIGTGFSFEIDVANIVFYGLRIVLLVGVISGISGSFKSSSLENKHRNTTNREIATLIQHNKPVTKGSDIIMRVIISFIAIAAAVYVFTWGGFAEGRNFEDWVDYTSGVVTVKMPSGRVQESSDRMQDMPGVKVNTAKSDGTTGSVILVTYVDILSFMGLSVKNANELEAEILAGYVVELDWEVTDIYNGNMGGRVRYHEMRMEQDGIPGAVRCFSGGDNIYVAAIFVSDVDYSNLIERFLNNIVVG